MHLCVCVCVCVCVFFFFFFFCAPFNDLPCIFVEFLRVCLLQATRVKMLCHRFIAKMGF